ncbi:hypothetical protein O3M35_007866 [Rhynocoris fuscipes]|uniref:DDB1- and CUL4-associated factor 8 n=1 Tax=Rhynocoris fuscipes TaxID=488301 RepID=A0AAW1DB22_9HEMI
MENNNGKTGTEGSNPEVRNHVNSVPQDGSGEGNRSPLTTTSTVDNEGMNITLEEPDSIDFERSEDNTFERRRHRRSILNFDEESANDIMDNLIDEQDQASSEDDEFDVGTDCDMWFVENSSSDSPERSETPTTAVTTAHVKTLISKPKPPHTWFIIKELKRRELGMNRMPENFTRKFYGSLHAVQRLELMYKLEEHTGCVNAINFNRSGTRLVSASDDRRAVIWDWATGKCLQAFNTGHESNVFQAKFLSLIGEEHIVTCSRDGQVRLALQNGSGIYDHTTKLVQHSKACHKISLLPHDPHVILSAGEDSTVFSIDIRERQATRLMHVKHDMKKIRLYSIHANPMTSNEIVIGGEDAYIRIYDRRNISSDGVAPILFKPAQVLKPYSAYVTCAVFNYNGTEVLGSYNDDDIYLFDAKAPSNSPSIHKYEGHRNSQTVKGVNFFGPRSEFVISGSDCGHIYLWDKNTESIVQWMRGDEDGVINCLEPHPWIPVLATSGLDSDVKIWIPSYEQDPKMEGLQETLLKNIRNKETRKNFLPGRDPFSEVIILGRWMRHLRYLEQNRRGGSSTPDPFTQRDDLFEASSASSSD